MKKKILSQIGVVLLGILMIAGCSPTYPKEKMINSIKELCKKEYGIENVHVKVSGNTVGVYLPVDQLFEADLEKLLAANPDGNIEDILKFHPDALDKIDDIMQAVTRAMLSSDNTIEFSVVKIVDTRLTGAELTFISNTLDRKRVHLMDISRNEYRKRIIQDMKINPMVVWKIMVREIFAQLGQQTPEEIIEDFFVKGWTPGQISEFFYRDLMETVQKHDVQYEILDIRTRPFPPDKGIVYAKVKQTYDEEKVNPEWMSVPSGTELEYLFVIRVTPDGYRIQQIIPFYFINEQGQLQKVNLPREMSVYQSLDQWPDEFDIKEIKLNDFVAGQVTLRVQHEFSGDERVMNTFTSLKMQFESFPNEDKEGYILKMDFVLRGNPALLPRTLEEYMQHEDIRYVLKPALSEFAYVARQYHSKYDFLRLKLNNGYVIDLNPEAINELGHGRATLIDLVKK